MLSRPLLRFVRDDRQIRFMRGRYAGLLISAFLSVASLVLFCVPGLNLGLDFRGGIIVETHSPTPEDPSHVRHILEQAHIDAASVQAFGSPYDVRIAINLPRGNDAEHQTQSLVDHVKQSISQALPGTQIQRADAVGGSVSSELFRDGVLALLLA